MAKKQFSPHIYAEWGELFEILNAEQKAEVLMGIVKYPNYQPVDVPIWNFIKSQLDKDYELFIDRCEKNGQISRNYWKNKKTNDTERIPNDTERYPKHITNNELRITNNELQITNNPDWIFENDFSKCFEIYSENCKNLIKLSFEKRNRETLALLDEVFEALGKDYDKFKELCLKANELVTIAEKKIDFKMMLRNYIGILNGKYKEPSILDGIIK